MKLHTVPVALVPDLWPAVEKLLARAVKWHPFLSVDGLKAIILSGHADLIVAIQDEHIFCAAVMEAVQYPGTKVGNVLVLAGERGTYARHIDAITDYLETWCAAHGCANIGMTGRPGWLKFVTRRGWRTQRYVSAWRVVCPSG